MGKDKHEITFLSAICPNCGANLPVDGNLKSAYCQYCGSKFLLNKAEKNYNIYYISNTVNNNITNRNNIVNQNFIDNRVTYEKKGFWAAMADVSNNYAERQDNLRKEYRKSLLSKFTLLFAIICALIFLFSVKGSINDHLGYIAIVQSLFLIISWLMGMRFIDTDNEGVYMVLFVISCALIIPFIIVAYLY